MLDLAANGNRDDGRYECFIDGKPHGSVTLHVITVGVSKVSIKY